MKLSDFRRWAVKQRGYKRYHTELLGMLGLFLEWHGLGKPGERS